MRAPILAICGGDRQLISKTGKDHGGDLLRGNGLSNLLETLR